MKTLTLLAILMVAQAAVVGIDLGGGFYKQVLIQSGEPFKIVENTSSK